jgi:hypothetical protein
MSFRQSIVFGLLLISTASCSYFFKEQKEPSNVYELTLDEKAGVSCIKDNSRLLREYFELKRDNNEMALELGKMKKCLKEAINLFVRHTKGAQQETYSTTEIHDFLSVAFDSYNYPLDFMQEAIVLKHSLLGGAIDSVTKDEIRKLPIYIDYVYDALAYHVPDRHLLFSKTKSDDFAGFLPARERFRKTVEKFKTLPRKANGIFDYDATVRLIKYFFDNQADMAEWDKTFELVNSLQALLSVGQVGQLEIQKLPSTVSNLSELYLGYIEFHKFLQDDSIFRDLSTVFTFPGLVTRIVKNPEVFTDATVEIAVDTQRQILKGVKDAASIAPQGKISLAYASDLITTLHKIGSIPDYIQPSTLQLMMPELFGCWLSQKGNCSQRLRDVQSLTVENIEILEKFSIEWKERQLWINKRMSQSKLASTKNGFINHARIAKEVNSQNIKSFLDVLSKVNHVHWEDYVVIGEKKINYKDLVIFNKLYTLGHLFTRPFNGNASKINLSEYYLDYAQSQFFYDWLRPLALDLKLGDPRSRTSGGQAMIEINLFGSNSSEPDKLNFSEALEYFEISISTGLKSVEIMENEFIECRLKDLPKDVFGYYRFDAPCYRNIFYTNHEKILFSTLPRLLNYLNNDPNADRVVMLNYLERAGRQGLIVDDPIETDAFRMMGSIIQYAESLFLRFDTDRSDVITQEELKAGFRHIVPNIRELIKSSLQEKEAKDLYRFFPNFEENLITYVIKHQEVPALLSSVEGYGTAELFAFRKWVDLMPSWLTRVQVKREDIVLVISALSMFSRTNRIKALRKLFDDYEIDFDKGINDLDHVAVREIVRLLQCSTFLDQQLKVWLVRNQDLYWKDVLTIKEVRSEEWSVFGIKFGGNSKEDARDSLSAKTRRALDLQSRWQGPVVDKLVQLVHDEPSLGPYCTLPFMEGVNNISPQQDAKKFECATGGGIGGLCVEKVYRTPY